MSIAEKNLEVLLQVYNRLMPIIERGITGRITLHCFLGEIKKLEINKIENISPDTRGFLNKKIVDKKENY